LPRFKNCGPPMGTKEYFFFINNLILTLEHWI
jgi:hypothetical protein